MFATMAEYMDKDNVIDSEEFEDGFKDTEAYEKMKETGTQYDDMTEDLFALLTDKTEGEVAIRVRGYERGDGVEAGT